MIVKDESGQGVEKAEITASMIAAGVEALEDWAGSPPAVLVEQVLRKSCLAKSSQDKEDHQTEYRGLILPAGMSPECLDSLAHLLNEHCRFDNDESNAECAIRIFDLVRTLCPKISL